MAECTKEQIKNLSHLCRIELSEEELLSFQKDLSKILLYVNQLSSVDLSQLTPSSHIEEQPEDLLRKDEISDLLPRELFLKNTPKQIGGMVAVPPVLSSS